MSRATSEFRESYQEEYPEEELRSPSSMTEEEFRILTVKDGADRHGGEAEFKAEVRAAIFGQPRTEDPDQLMLWDRVTEKLNEPELKGEEMREFARDIGAWHDKTLLELAETSRTLNGDENQALRDLSQGIATTAGHALDAVLEKSEHFPFQGEELPGDDPRAEWPKEAMRAVQDMALSGEWERIPERLEELSREAERLGLSGNAEQYGKNEPETGQTGDETRAAMFQVFEEPERDAAAYEFVEAAKYGSLTPEQINLFVHGGKPEFGQDRDPEGPEPSLLAFGEDLRREVEAAFSDITRNLGEDFETAKMLHERMMHNAQDHLMEHSPNFPLQDLDHPDPYLTQVWERHWQERMDEAGKRMFGAIHHVAGERNREAAAYGETGELPEWLDPDIFNERTMSVSPELKAMGYSEMHNTPIDIFDRTENIEHYLKAQMDAHVAADWKTNLGEDPAEFGRALLRPELDEDLSAKVERFDPGNFYYTDDGPINYEENRHVKMLVEGDAQEPKEHFEVTYARMVRDALMHKGIADDADRNDTESLAMSYPRNVMTLHRMADFAHEAMEAADSGQWERPDMPGYDPVVRWDQDPERNLEAMTEHSADFTDIKALQEKIQDVGEALYRNFDPGDVIDHDSRSRNYSFMPQPGDPGDRDVDHPSAILLREGLGDLREAAGFLEWSRYDEIREELREAFVNGEDLREKTLAMASENGNYEIPDYISRRLEYDSEAAKEKALRQGETWSENDAMLLDMGRKMQDFSDELPDPDEMIRRAMDRMTHADFCLTMSYQAANGDSQ